MLPHPASMLDKQYYPPEYLTQNVNSLPWTQSQDHMRPRGPAFENPYYAHMPMSNPPHANPYSSQPYGSSNS
ncbi:hypothetical protein BDP27DRAFT_1314751 [Rhodocollybia butyracea]|uniref:Uncharacterized protein n=1 Tax=Rhodocollybia butyracea TaxID=206335 RepID=A0A9P5UE74_9AGAR|nr:hypothetical protein BDP27DRAFT_1314751 [Rhodocollybia butyracea]